MSRRRFLFAAFGCAFAAPFRSLAQQQGRIRRVGFLAFSGRPDSLQTHFYGAFPQRLRELGYVEGRNLVIEWRFADGNAERLPSLAEELVRLGVEAIVAGSTPATSAAQKATATIPIIMASATDPVGSGFIASLARPGGNITGLSNLAGDTTPKHLEMLLGIAPKGARVAVLLNPSNVVHPSILTGLRNAAQKVKAKVVPVEARTEPQIETAFSTMSREKVGAVIVVRDGFFNRQVRQIAALAIKNRLPSIAGIREYVEAGGLMSYGPNLADQFAHAAVYVDKILNGAKPSDLPVEQPTTFEFVVNLKTARALGIKIPASIMVQATKVIE